MDNPPCGIRMSGYSYIMMYNCYIYNFTKTKCTLFAMYIMRKYSLIDLTHGSSVYTNKAQGETVQGLLLVNMSHMGMYIYIRLTIWIVFFRNTCTLILMKQK